MNRLTRRVEALEQAIGVVEGLPCLDCGLGHIHDVLSLDRLAEHYAGSRESTPPLCPCACCAPIFADLVGRLSRHGEGAA